VLERDDLELAVFRERHQLVDHAFEFLPRRVGWGEDGDALPVRERM